MTLHKDELLLPIDDIELIAVVEADELRQQTMLSSDIENLETLLADEVVYIHSSAMVDNERTCLLPPELRQSSYEAIDITVTEWRYLTPNVVLLNGRSVMRAVQSGQSKPLDSLFVATWVKYPDGWRMASWQSTPVKES